MLGSSTTDRALTAEVQAYLHDALGAEARILPQTDVRKLPYFLRDTFELCELELHGRRFVLASVRGGRAPALSTLRTQLDKLAQLTGRPVVFAAPALASYERKRLVQQKVPFVVPGNQLYFPDLGIDFREYFRQQQAAVTALTPATQAIFIAALLRREWHAEWQPADMLAELGYTAMTLSRAVRELTAAGLVTARQEGRARSLQPNHPPDEAWEHAKPFLRSPVKRSMWVKRDPRVDALRLPLAGLSALAFYSMLTDPPHRIYAVSSAQWRDAQHAGFETIPEAQHDASQWQLWSYAPNLQIEYRAVDPLSLTLSLRDEPDERVQQALEDLRGEFPW